VLVGRHEFVVHEEGPPEAPPILLLHGWVYDGLTTWHRVMPLLAETHRVIILDLRNHGRSPRIPGRFEIETLGYEVAGVMDALALGSVPVVGYSMGGMAAQALVHRHPGRVEKLVLVSTAAKPVRHSPWLTKAVFFAGRAIARIDPMTLPRLAHAYLLRTGAVAPEHAAWLWEGMLDRDITLYYESAFAIGRFDAREWAGSIDVPTLCLIPTSDRLIPPSQQYETADRIPGAEVIEIEGGRHEIVLTHPETVAGSILGFVSQTKISPGGEIDA
jgi:pimeloyl-ACP methyl ester carboxylesterase